MTCYQTGIRKAVSWYNKHLASMNNSPRIPTIVLLTDDVANRQKAEKERITAISGTPYHTTPEAIQALTSIWNSTQVH